MKRKNRIILSVATIGILTSSANLSYSTYIQTFEATQTISAAPWEVDASIEHQSQTVDGQVFKGFRPGDIKENIIKLKNDNNYKVKFSIEVKTSDKLFENPNINISINPVGISKTKENITYNWNDIQQNQEDTIYYIDIELEPNSEKWMKLDIVWNKKDENYNNYQGQSGQVVYKSKAEQVIENEESINSIN